MKSRTAVALGLFDGIHTGHRLILNKALSYPEYMPAVFTFNTESIKFKHGKPFEFIYPNVRKLEIIRSMGFDYIESPDFDTLKNLEGEDFARKILVQKMNAGIVICGENFRFGKNASCNADNLHEFGEKYNFRTEVIKLAEKSGNTPVSSGIIRELLKQGRISELSELGFCYTVKNTVSEGNRIGRTINFPTINQHFADGQLVPKYGVYYSETIIDNMNYPSVTNIGVKPTVENNIKPLAETHILGYSGNLYGICAEVRLKNFIRSEKKFSSVDELKVQIAEDIKYIKTTVGKD
ncbi:MAG: riboflavin kinase [Ruminococcus sp.]|nr:riboflavin kinase [Oscillospiraceae bacterium]MDY4413580.1 riboflavin kinase [Ruminococcus sp.]